VRWRSRMRLFIALAGAAVALLGAAAPVMAQQDQMITVDSLVVEGNSRVPADQIIESTGIVRFQPTTNYRTIQRAIQALFATGQFDDVTIEQRGTQENVILAIIVKERPVLQRWAVRGAEQVSESQVRSKVVLLEARPLDRAAVGRARAAIDSLYQKKGYYAARIQVNEIEAGPGAVRLVFDITEGNRVAISQVVIEGNSSFKDNAVVEGMESKPEGFWWFQKGEFNEDKLDEDIRARLPQWYGDRGHVDFQVLSDTLIADSVPGKAILKLTVDEGEQYHVGTFEVQGNRRYSTEEVSFYFPFGKQIVAGRGDTIDVPFSQAQWQAATDKLKDLYANTGYIYADVAPELTRRTGPDGKSWIDLRWNIREGAPATINRILVLGNDVTHERVIREQIVMVPGQLFNREALIRSYQNVSNLNFFQQPLPRPDVQPTESGDVDIIFRVTERRTGNVQFGASVGQGTGVGGFIGLEEPNLFGKAKRGKVNWQFGRNINDFTLQYADPAIRESRISGTITLFNSRQRFTVGDLGRRLQTGGTLQVGLPLLGARYTRLFGLYSYQRITYEGGSEELRQRFRCEDCARSTLGLSLSRDTRIGLPFPIAGQSVTLSAETNGGWLGGTGDYNKFDVEGRWYTPLGTLGGGGQLGAGVQFVLGLTAKSGFVVGDAGPFFTELYSMGGVQFGIPLRGYDEFAITPEGFDVGAGGNTAAGENSFGKSYAAFTAEAGARISQALYLNLFFDAGNVYREARQYSPLRLFRSLGVGIAVISPLGPLGVDLGYGLDRLDSFGRPDPGWKLHFRLGNFF
jgi:outer membrane protein insertion porin family